MEKTEKVAVGILLVFFFFLWKPFTEKTISAFLAKKKMYMSCKKANAVNIDVFFCLFCQHGNFYAF